MDLAPPIRFELRRGAITAIPLAIAVGLFGVSFGVLSAATGGMGALPAIVMSATTFAGSAQFAAASVIAGGGGWLAAIGAALLLNARYLPIGVSVARFLVGTRLARFVQSQLLVDESWAIAARGGGTFDPHRLVGAGIVLWCAWVAGTVLAALVATAALGNGQQLVLDARMIGLGAAAVALVLRAPVLLVVVIAAATAPFPGSPASADWLHRRLRP